LRIGIGFDARKVAYADRNLKNRIGMLAYSVAGLKAIKDSKQARYHLTIDGHQVESAAVTCLIDNAGNMGIQGVEPVKNIRIDDGYLDVLLLGTPGMFNTVSSGAAFLETGISDLLVEHWQAKQIIVEVDPAQPVQVDGEIVHDTPITAEIMPGALNVIIPKPK
jgi:diacylglycerol kinase family enzyme